MHYLSGIGRSTRELLHALAGMEQLPFEIVMFTQHVRGSIPGRTLPFRHLNFPMPAGTKFDGLLQGLPVLDFAVRHEALHIPHNYAQVHNPEKTLVTMHDTLFFSSPEQRLGHDFAKTHYPRLARSCKAIITCSRSSKDDIVHYMGVPPEKVTVVPWGVDRSVFFPIDKPEARKAVRASTGQERPFFISVSCSDGRKNTSALMHAYRLALQERIDHDLLLVWERPPEQYLHEFGREIASGRIRLLSNVDDALLVQLYAAATASWFPSRYEGFGLPVLESMACGTPVVTCRNSSLIEVGGSAALFVAPDDLRDMADMMTEFDKGFSRYDELVSRSLAHVSTFTWERTATAYVEFYQKNM